MMSRKHPQQLTNYIHSRAKLSHSQTVANGGTLNRCKHVIRTHNIVITREPCPTLASRGARGLWRHARCVVDGQSLILRYPIRHVWRHASRRGPYLVDDSFACAVWPRRRATSNHRAHATRPRFFTAPLVTRRRVCLRVGRGRHARMSPALSGKRVKLYLRANDGCLRRGLRSEKPSRGRSKLSLKHRR
jgi:hypothetical protein